MNKKNIDDIANSNIGFEDFIKNNKTRTRLKPSVDRSDEGKIFSFLENNHKRLENISKLIQNQLPSFIDFDQSHYHLDQLRRNNESKKNYLVDFFSSSESFLHSKNRDIFDTHFESNN